jgi:hypothetical protein
MLPKGKRGFGAREGSALTCGLSRVRLIGIRKRSNIVGEGMINPKKMTLDVLQEEMLRERAATLARAGERLGEALGMIQHQRIEEFYRIPPKMNCLPER